MIEKTMVVGGSKSMGWMERIPHSVRDMTMWILT